MKIVILDAYTSNPGDLSWDAFNELGELVIYDRTAPSETVERCQAAEIVLTNKVLLKETEISQLPNLKYIGVLATGTNVIDLDYAKEKGIVVTNVPAYSTDSVAQHIFSFILHFSSQVAPLNATVQNGDWANSVDFSYTLSPLHELKGKTLSIIGLGSIGRKTAEIANTFGMKICAAHQSSMNRLELPYEVEWLETEELFKRADFLSLSCPLKPETEEIISKENLSLMKPSAYLINTGRGPLINEADLAEALNNNVIAGAGLDVLSQEPPPGDNPLLSAQNCVITPHVAWASQEARTRLIAIAANNVKAWQNDSTENQVNI